MYSSQDFCSRKVLFLRKILIFHKRKETPLRKRIQSPVQFICEEALLTVDIFTWDSFIPSASIRPIWYVYNVHWLTPMHVYHRRNILQEISTVLIWTLYCILVPLYARLYLLTYWKMNEKNYPKKKIFILICAYFCFFLISGPKCQCGQCSKISFHLSHQVNGKQLKIGGPHGDIYLSYRISGYFGCVKFWLFWAKTGVRILWLILILALPGSGPKLPYFWNYLTT